MLRFEFEKMHSSTLHVYHVSFPPSLLTLYLMVIGRMDNKKICSILRIPLILPHIPQPFTPCSISVLSNSVSPLQNYPVYQSIRNYSRKNKTKKQRQKPCPCSRHNKHPCWRLLRSPFPAVSPCCFPGTELHAPCSQTHELSRQHLCFFFKLHLEL